MWPFKKRDRARKLWKRQLEIDAAKEFVAEYPGWLTHQLREANGSRLVGYRYDFDLYYKGYFKIPVIGTEYWWEAVKVWVCVGIELRKPSSKKEGYEKVNPREVPLEHLFAVAAVLEEVTVLWFRHFPFLKKYLSIVLK